MTEREAAGRIAEWKAHARRIGREHDHSGQAVLSLFDRTGQWSKPYADAGFGVLKFDIARGQDLVRWFPSGRIMRLQDDGFEIVGVLAAPPCTSFAGSGARWWREQHDAADTALVEQKYGWFAAKYFDSPIEYAQCLIYIVQAIVELAAPTWFHAMENPVGRIARITGLSKPLLSFDPCDYGNPYTKRTLLWGRFNPDLPVAPVTPSLGSRMHRLRGDNPKQKAERSVTPEGFSYAFFMANHGARAQATQLSLLDGAA